jgi:hypothetical protein
MWINYPKTILFLTHFVWLWKGPNLKRRDSQMEKGLADDVQVTDAAADVANAAASRPRLQSLHEVVTRPPEDAAPTAAPAPGTPPNDIVSTPPLFLAPGHRGA